MRAPPCLTLLRSPRTLLLLIACLLALPGATAAALPAAVEQVRVLVSRGAVEQALEAAEVALQAHPDSAQAWMWAGRAYGQQAMRAGLLSKPRWAGRTRDAFQRAVALDPSLLEAHFDLLNYYRYAPGIMGGGADKAALQAQAIAARDASLGHTAEALLAQDQEQDETAVAALLGRALALDPDNLRARQLLAAQAEARKDWAAVRAVWEAQLQRDRHQALARYQLGRCAALSNQQLQQGLEHLDGFIADARAAGDALEEGLNIAAAHWRRGQILEKLGRTGEALADWKLAREDERIRSLADADLKRVTGT